MESLQSATSSSFSATNIQYSLDSLVIQTSLAGNDDDATSIDINKLSTGLSVTAQQMIEKLNELLKGSLPGGIQSLKPEDHTSEKTAERIVQGVTSLYHTYAKQHPELEGEELLNSFMEKARAGIDAGYDDAYSTLQGIGAFDVDGVKSGVEQTKVLIEDKMKAFEQEMRKQLGIDVEDSVKTQTYNGLLTSAGANTGLSVVA